MNALSTPLPGRWGAALYESRISHLRTAPVRHAVRQRGYLWLVDLDRMPELPAPLRPLARFPAGAALRADLDAFLAAQGLEPPGGRVLMLCQARSLGHVFNPLTVYWCHDRAGRPVCTVAEVHNTYGQRHRYLLRTDARGRAETAKEFYVSPFFPVAGRYRMSLPEPGPRLRLAVSLELDGARPFTATVHGSRRPAGPAALLGAVLRHPLATFAVSAGIRYHGVRLWLRGLPVHPRPQHAPQEEAPRP
ncbi:DUF1365 domain-containing protein [Kitasatospora viridis]|uniref:DUF1365 family protein n=1 Tax=Kitasatospora viridis TaxID=281105 RepID=A0A561TSZ9_9ACTN|nr:DUF1365 domain-containing protein [Kitasatospora viridis]TWF90245.1 hypothetical protein FHX73_13289 [Kitasatospora viridis]